MGTQAGGEQRNMTVDEIVRDPETARSTEFVHHVEGAAAAQSSGDTSGSGVIGAIRTDQSQAGATPGGTEGVSAGTGAREDGGAAAGQTIDAGVPTPGSTVGQETASSGEQATSAGQETPSTGSASSASTSATSADPNDRPVADAGATTQQAAEPENPRLAVAEAHAASEAAAGNSQGSSSTAAGSQSSPATTGQGAQSTSTDAAREVLTTVTVFTDGSVESTGGVQ